MTTSATGSSATAFVAGSTRINKRETKEAPSRIWSRDVWSLGGMAARMRRLPVSDSHMHVHMHMHVTHAEARTLRHVRPCKYAAGSVHVHVHVDVHVHVRVRVHVRVHAHVHAHVHVHGALTIRDGRHQREACRIGPMRLNELDRCLD